MIFTIFFRPAETLNQRATASLGRVYPQQIKLRQAEPDRFVPYLSAVVFFKKKLVIIAENLICSCQTFQKIFAVGNF